MGEVKSSIVFKLVILTVLNFNECRPVATIDLQRTQELDCPGSCTTLLGCKSSGGKVVGFCIDGKMCCGGGNNVL